MGHSHWVGWVADRLKFRGAAMLECPAARGPLKDPGSLREGMVEGVGQVGFCFGVGVNRTKVLGSMAVIIVGIVFLVSDAISLAKELPDSASASTARAQKGLSQIQIETKPNNNSLVNVSSASAYASNNLANRLQLLAIIMGFFAVMVQQYIQHISRLRQQRQVHDTKLRLDIYEKTAEKIENAIEQLNSQETVLSNFYLRSSWHENTESEDKYSELLDSQIRTGRVLLGVPFIVMRYRIVFESDSDIHKSITDYIGEVKRYNEILRSLIVVAISREITGDLKHEAPDLGPLRRSTEELIDSLNELMFLSQNCLLGNIYRIRLHKKNKA